MMARRSTSKGCPRLPHRDATERNKAMLSPWALSGAASAQADRPRTARRKATREGGAKALSAGQCDESTSCRAAGTIVALAPSVRGHALSPEQTKKGARLGELSSQAHYPDRRIVTSAGPAPRCAWWVYSTDRSLQRGKSPNYPLAESLDSTKASGATVGYHD